MSDANDGVHLGARARARAEITSEITAAARRQLAVDGAPGLSLRAIARELGMVSSAIYRYVSSRDELLTLLIVEAYDSLGAAVERAVADVSERAPADRLVVAARAIRAWGVEHPNEYALVYGSPVPGYAAPQDTIAPASRVTLAIVGVVVDAHTTAPLPAPSVPVTVTAAMEPDLAAVRAALDVDLPDEVIVATITAWTQIFGLVSFELFGQTRNVIEAHADLLDATALLMASVIGLPDTAP